MTPEELVGRKGPDYEVVIERGKVREFARAMDAPLEAFMAGNVIPATFLVSAPYTWGYTLERPRGTFFGEIEHDLSVPLHAEESFIFHGKPPSAGERLTARACLESVDRKTGRSGGEMTFLVMLTEYFGADGALRAEQRSTTVTTGQTPDDGTWEASSPAYDPDCGELEPASPFAGVIRQAFEAIAVGEGPQPVSLPPLTIQAIMRFQGVVGEDNPLHYDLVWAQKQGYPQVFALGMHQASQMAAYAAHWLPPEAVRGFRVRFKAIGWPGDRYVISGRITEKDASARTARLHLTCARTDGTLVNEAWMDFNFSEE